MNILVPLGDGTYVNPANITTIYDTKVKRTVSDPTLVDGASIMFVGNGRNADAQITVSGVTAAHVAQTLNAAVLAAHGRI